MSIKKILLAACAAATLFSSAASAQPCWVPPGNDPGGYYSDSDHSGYYDQQGRYEDSCRRGNTAAGTIFGALAGGLIGGAASRGNGGAVVGGVVLGGLLGNVIGRDIDCEDQPVAYRVYAQGLNGDLGRPNEWSNRGNRGTFTPTREFRRGDQVCREFSETTYRRDQSFTRTGVACREIGTGNWRFD